MRRFSNPAGFGRIKLRLVHLLCLIVIAFLACSAVLAGTASGEGLFAGIDRLIMPIVFFVVAPVLFADARARQFLARTFLVLTVYLSIVSIGQVGGLSWLVWPSTSSIPQ